MTLTMRHKVIPKNAMLFYLQLAFEIIISE